MFNSTFKIVYFVLFMIISIVRKFYTSKQRKKAMLIEKKSGGEIFFLVLNAIGMIIPLIYVFTSSLDFANYYMPDWVGWLGLVLFMDATWLLYLSHRDLGRHWTITVGLREDHKLVTKGIYKHIRHPMYAAHILWAIAQPLILPNWIAGFSFIIPQILMYWFRVGEEEQMMLEHFGEEYRTYVGTTGRILPKIGREKSD